MEEAVCKESLLKKRAEILAESAGKPLKTWLASNARQGDVADKASGHSDVHIELKIEQTNAKILYAIEEALWRIEQGTYGLCRDCGKAIAWARLNAIPWTRVCITCKEKQRA